MKSFVSTPVQHPAHTMQGLRFARIVATVDTPPCTVEAGLQERGAEVTRLLATQLLFAKPRLDDPTLQVLGRLYDGLIVPRDGGINALGVAMAAGLPVVFDDQDLSAFDA